jgi:CubicO group peptidase (beta-lactamase class C family)
MEQTRRAVLAGAAFAAAIGASVVDAKPRRKTTTLVGSVRRAVQAIMDVNGVPGASAALLMKGKTVWQESFGSTKASGNQPIDTHTIFSIQSTSKTFTATAVMLAVQRGLVDLDAPITHYLPDFTVNSRHEEAPQSKITLRHLLSHHAGFTHEAPIGNNYTLTPWTFEDHIRSIQETWLRYPVGERFSYSNLGIDLAAHILERVSGMAYWDCLKAWLLAPLGMTDTTANPDEYAARSNRAIGHVPGYSDLPVRIPLLGSGGVYSSITDMARYTAFHLREGRNSDRQILDTNLWREMHDFRYGGDYALGIGRRTETFAKFGRVFTHDGGGFGFGCCFHYCPVESLGWIILMNGATHPVPNSNPNPFDDILIDPILKSYDIAPIKPKPPSSPSIAMVPETLRQWVGSYLNGDAHLDMTLENGALVLRDRNDPRPDKLLFVSPDKAWVADPPIGPRLLSFQPAKGREAQRFAMVTGANWDFNDGPSVPPGPIRDGEYDALLGRYEINVFGKPVATATISQKNGYLYFNDVRATPHLPGLFFGGSGEALDMRGPIATARNIPLKRLG